jgi:ArsR family transcriptional regulator, lead/cadmium/zinc/bismuth-responsive transcriptional repressor
MSTSSDVLGLDTCAVRVIDSERVDALQRGRPGEADILVLSEVFALLGEPGRLRMLMALLHGELCVCDLAAVVGLSESATSHALRILRAHRVVSVRRAGRMAYYALADGHVRTLLEVALAHVAHREPVLERSGVGHA